MACLMLVVYHTIGANETQGLRVDSGLWREIVDLLGAVRMPVFALIAGAMWAARPVANMSALAHKAERLLVPMLTVGTLFALMQALVPGGQQLPVQDWHLLHIVPVAHYWFLEALFLDIALVMAIERLGLLRTPGQMAAWTAIAWGWYLSHPAFIWFGVAGAGYLLPYFLCGIALVRFGAIAPSHATTVIVASALLAGLALLGGWIPTNDRFTPAMLACGTAVAAGLWIFPPRWHWLQWVGGYSFAIFLFHPFFTAGMRKLLNVAGFDAFSLHVALGVSAGVLVPVLLRRSAGRMQAAAYLLFGEPARRLVK
jgi:surface polysaccharide O-acyltransferase-like enzyme